MLVEFKNLPEESRVWIYQANRSFATGELAEIESKLAKFLTQWTAHGANLDAGYEVRYKRFIVIGLNQSLSQATGCSIDASVHFIQQLEKDYDVDLLDKMNVSFKQGEYVTYKPLSEFKSLVKNKGVSANTIVFNNLVLNKSEYLEHWEVPAQESWHNRFF